MKSTNPTLAALSYWWKHRMWVGEARKMAKGLAFFVMVIFCLALAMALFMLCMTVLFSSIGMLSAVWSGHPGTYMMEGREVKGYVLPGFVFLESLGLAHPVGFFVGAALMGSMTVGSVIAFFNDYRPFARWKKGYWVITGCVGLPFSAWGLCVLVACAACAMTAALGFFAWITCKALVHLPARLRARRDAFLASHPEAMANREKQMIEEGLPPSTKSSDPSRL
jgi:hypothetical protein